jgi:DNA-directed RNA polymerase I, II, and III subunit RPABC2
MAKVVRNEAGIIIDDLHKTVPFLTKYEKTSIIGQRAKHINSGANPFVIVPANVIDGYLIATMELNEKKIPFIIRRPIPGGSCEYWHVNDLELI